MAIIKLTPEQRDKKAIAAYRASDHELWFEQDTRIHNFWRWIAIAVLEADGDKVEIIEPEPEIPESVIDATYRRLHLDGAYGGYLCRRAVEYFLIAAYTDAGWGGWLPGREPK
jgi:hypothetical protein